MVDKKITIIGLGLIGGSLARVLRERLHIEDITAITRNAEAIQTAINDGSIKRGFSELNEYVFDSDIIFICTPVKSTINYITMLSDKVKPGCILTDVGSTKSEILKHVNSLPSPPCFIGGHPMAGAEKTGYTSSFSHLFENAYYILSPSKSSTTDALDVMVQIVKTIGGIPIVIDADTHDYITGSISHVPHIIASALVNMVKQLDRDSGKMQMLAAGGFKDITRIASSSPEMWENIVLSNKEKIKGILESYVETLNTFKAYIENDDSKEIFNFFESAKAFRDTFPNTKQGLITPTFEIVVDVVDKPGIIGEIATLLGTNLININNINVSNNREFEQGCLKIQLPDSESMNAAFNLLISEGYQVFKN